METMYPGKVNSPQTELASAITDTDTTIPLLDASVLPDPPNICTIGTGEDAETVLYEGKNGNDLTDVTRGFQGAAKAWVQGTKVARNFTAYDYDALRQNVVDHVAATTSVHGATSEATPNTIVQRDPAGRFKAAAPSASDDVARKAETDAALSAAQAAAQTATQTANELAAHLAGKTSELKYVERDLSLEGDQLVVFTKEPKTLFINGIVENSNKVAIGRRTQDGETSEGVISDTGVWTKSIIYSTAFYDSEIDVTGAKITIDGNNVILHWQKEGSGATGTARLTLVAVYHD